MISTYPNELLQVLLNLLSNAKDAHRGKQKKGAFIRIETQDLEEGTQLSVCDNAGGIAQEVISRIGQPYFTTKKENGTGLGIYMSKTIIQKHLNGRLEWSNKAKGACFVILLPA
jgi:two-component system CheB/CheR fusion protein